MDDEFGVLVESIGFKSQSQSAPLSHLKNNNKKPPPPTTNINPTSNDFIFKPTISNDYDDVFGVGNLGTNNFDDFFGVGKFTSSGSGNGNVDDVFGGVAKRSHSVDDLFGASRKVEPRNSVDDLFGDFVGVGVKSNGAKRNVGSDELLPGFASNATSNGRKSESTFSQQSGHSAKPVSSFAEDPFEFLGGVQTRTGPESRTSEIGNYFDSMFTPGAQSSSRRSWNSSAEDVVFDTLFQSTKVSNPGHNASEKSKSTVNVPPVANSSDDYSFLFGLEEAAPLSGQFQEIDGESGERRTSRLNHHLRTQERMAKALKEKNQRDQQAQREQEERDRIADTLDNDLKRWAAGKEGNLRALLSSLQHVLWSDSGWVAVSLTDLITSTSVKKVYHKATLCVHPDKVQQKGANVQQKYIASKVFDLLQEAYNKFNAEELKKQ